MEEETVHLLLLEDNAGDARLIRELLRQAEPFRFELTQVELLADAVERLAQGEMHAALLDLSLPDAQGMDVVIQALGAAPEVAFVVLTGQGDERMAVEAVRAGAQDYLVKGEITGRLLVHSIRYAIERARLERERWNLLHREHQARTRAEAAVRSRDELLAIVAHDLRNPLSTVNTTVDLLRKGAIPLEQYPQQFEVVLRSAEQMERLIQDLLDAARIEGGSLRLEPRPVPVGALLGEALGHLEAQAARAGLLLRTEIEADAPQVRADPQRILQVLSNLVGNALRFSPRGGEITLGARRFGDGFLFSVTDTGVGIPREDLPHLFDRNWQAKYARRGGTGRGLAISRGIVAAHGGRIWAASELGKGCTFFFTLPLAAEAAVGEGASPSEATPAEASPAEAAASPGRTGRALRVLLVDDHAAIRHGLATILDRAEAIGVVSEAATGEEALERAERLRPDVVVMDLVMPGMGGIEATRQITASMPEIRVLALTAEAEEDALLPVLRAGGSGFVRKTTAHEDLLPALIAVANDEVFLYPSGNRLLLNNFLRDQDPGPLAALNDQDQQILRLAAEGFNSVEIGKKLFLSPKTIDSYRSRLMRQLGLSRRSDLVRLALRSGLLRPQPAELMAERDGGQATHGPALPPYPALPSAPGGRRAANRVE
jgi:signal transduction histidine kinase/DNA-binding CsgD family transcriptional regulator